MTPSPTRAKFAKPLKTIGMALIAVGVILDFGFRFLAAEWDDDDPRRMIRLLSFFVVAGGAFLCWRGRQYAHQAHAENIITASKARVLYLREFRADPTTAQAVFKAIGQAQSLLRQDLITDEEHLGDMLRPFGDLIAIGQPGEGLPKPGAARIYTSDEEWKDVVKREMQAAQLVVIRGATTESIFWELTQAIEIMHPQKILILFMDMALKDYEAFRVRANSVLDVPLPESKQVRSTGWRGCCGWQGVGPAAPACWWDPQALCRYLRQSTPGQGSPDV